MRDLVARPLLARGRIDVTPCLCPRHLEPIRSPQGSCVTFVGTRSRSSGSRSRCKSVSLQADCASLSRACALLVACARPHLVYVCIVFINTSYEEKIPKHGHGEVPVAAAVRLLARGGPCGRCCCVQDGCLAFRRRLGRRPGPNPTPNQATPAAARKCSLAGHGTGPGRRLGWPAGRLPMPMAAGPSGLRRGAC
jgi:hypothetical protein